MASIQDRMKGWRRLITAAETHAAELPSLVAFKGELEEALEEVTILKSKQRDLERRRLKATDALNERLGSCGDLGKRLQSYVKASFDRRDDRLVDFGITPAAPVVIRRNRKKGGTAPPATTETAKPQ